MPNQLSGISVNPSGRRSAVRLAAAMALFAPLLSAPFLGAHTSAQAAVTPITGVVFDDLNGNGIKEVAEPGIDGVSLAAYDATGASVSTSTTSGGGNYSLGSTDSAAQYRVEATKPANWEAGPKGAGLTSFANGGAVLNIGLFDPSSWCQSNPNVATSCFRTGDSADGSVSGQSDLISFPANSTGTVSASTLGTQGNLGSVWGLAYRPSTTTTYAAAYVKRHTGLLAGGAGAVYAVTNGTVSTLATIPSVGFSASNATRGLAALTDPSADQEAFAAVGLQGLGGMDISGDESTLYVVNLFDKNIYPIATSTGTVGSPIALPSISCTNGQVRPFGLTWRAGSVYVGVVCDASSGTSANLSAHVVAYNGASWSTVLSFPLNYAKGCAVTWANPDAGCAWNPWSDTVTNFSGNEYTDPQPMLSSIDFDATGAMVLGLRDRNGDRFSKTNTAPAGFPTAFAGYQSGGDLLRAADNGDGTYTLEANGTAGTLTTSGAGNSQGPGGGEFYFEDSYANEHDETSMGAVAVLPGGFNVLATMIDPAVPGRTTYTGGVEAFSNSAGTRSASALLYDSNTGNGTFGKANGLGDLELLCDAAPIEIGDRVWVDSDSDGVQDAGEAPLASVTVLLKNGSGTTVSTAVTDASGNYLFSNGTGSSTASAIYGLTGLLANTAYSISVDTTQSAITTPGYVLTTADASSTPSLGADERDSDATLNGSAAVISLTTGAPGQNNHSYDIGFATPAPTYCLGNRVWNDANDNGIVDNGETGIDSVSVTLKTTAGATVATDTTKNGGYYEFCGLAAGDYIVSITTPTGYRSSAGTSNAFEPAPSAETNVTDSDDNGTANGATIAAVAVTLGGSAEPTGEPATPGSSNTTPDNRSNLTVDFGLVAIPTYCLGNRVWNDTNDNGIVDNGETGRDGVTMSLYTGAGSFVTSQPTANGGYYEFCGLAAGDYYVSFTTPGGTTSSSANGAYEPAPSAETNATDNDDNGTTSGATIRSATVTLGTPEPTGEPATPGSSNTTPDNRSNLTVDFGLVPVATPTYCLGNRVWNDANDNGVVDNGETGIDSVSVNLYTSTGTLVGTVPTANGGYYEFCSLAAGNYYVSITTPTGYTSSSANGTYEPAPSAETNATDNDDNGTTSGATIISAVVTLGTPEPTGEPATPGSSNTTPDNQSNLTVDFGLVPTVTPGLAALGDYVWNDTNKNGIQDTGEAGVDGVTVELLDANGNPFSTPVRQVTSNGGAYLFNNLAPGDYRVRFTLPAGATFTVANSGTDDLKNSDADVSTGLSPVYNLIAGEIDRSVDAGLILPPTTTLPPPTVVPPGNSTTTTTTSTTTPSSTTTTAPTSTVPGTPTTVPGTPTTVPTSSCVTVGDDVYSDKNRNAVRDANERGIPNATVTVTGADGKVYTATTDASGKYIVSCIPAGNYSVKVSGVDPLAKPTTPTELVPFELTVNRLDADFGFDMSSVLGFDLERQDELPLQTLAYSGVSTVNQLRLISWLLALGGALVLIATRRRPAPVAKVKR